jgi:hypothetical protein
MIKPSLSDFSVFADKQKPVKIKTKFEVKKEQSYYMNIILLLLVVIGCIILYYRKKYKTDREDKAKETIHHLEDYMNDYIIHDMLKAPNYNIS